ncbi:hypothetical protein EDB87DRAFT_1825717, partial [Lactarius vividus]
MRRKLTSKRDTSGKTARNESATIINHHASMALYWIGQGAQHRDSSLLLNKYKTQYKKQASKWTLRRPTWMVTSSFSPPIILRLNVS